MLMRLIVEFGNSYRSCFSYNSIIIIKNVFFKFFNEWTQDGSTCHETAFDLDNYGQII